MFTNVEEYIGQYPIEIQQKLQEVRSIIKDLMPEDTIEKISWNMPTFYKKENIIHFAGHKNHIGLYPGAKVIETLKDELSNYKFSKGAIQLKYDEKLPKQLIKRIIELRLKEI